VLLPLLTNVEQENSNNICKSDKKRETSTYGVEALVRIENKDKGKQLRTQYNWTTRISTSDKLGITVQYKKYIRFLLTTLKAQAEPMVTQTS